MSGSSAPGTRLIEVRRLRLLYELNRVGSLAAVAESLHVSPSSVSSQLSLLERELGVKLLERVGRGVRLTPAARGALTHISAILSHLEQIAADVASADRVPRGTVRIASFQSAMIDLLPPLLERLGRYRDLRVEVTQMEPEQSQPALLGREFDLILGEEFPVAPAPLDPAIFREDLCRDSFQIATSQGFRSGSEAGPLDLRELRNQPWVVEPHDTISHTWVVGQCRKRGFEPDIRFETPDLLAHIALVSAGHAVAILPDLFTSRHRDQVRLSPLPGASRVIYMAMLDSRAETPSLRLIRDELQTLVTLRAHASVPPSGS